MKRILFPLLLCLLLLLTGCQPSDGTGVHTVTLGSSLRDAQVVVVDLDADTLTMDGATYPYIRDGGRLVIQFGEGMQYSCAEGKPDSYRWTGVNHPDSRQYVDLAFALAKAYWLVYEKPVLSDWNFHPLVFLLSLGFFAWGAWCRRDPEAVFDAQHWRYKNLEPSEDGLDMIRAEAWIIWLFGFFLLIASFV